MYFKDDRLVSLSVQKFLTNFLAGDSEVYSYSSVYMFAINIVAFSITIVLEMQYYQYLAISQTRCKRDLTRKRTQYQQNFQSPKIAATRKLSSIDDRDPTDRVSN